MPAMTSEQVRCGAIWGGISAVDLDVSTSGIIASVYSGPSSGEHGGDIYYFSVCGSDALTRIAVADVQGHGGGVSLLSGWLYDSMQDRLNTLDGAAVLSDLNRQVHSRGFEAITTAAVVSYYRGDSNLYFSYAGHPPAFLHRRGEPGWRLLTIEDDNRPTNLPLGVLPEISYSQRQADLAPGDRLFLYTDGVLDCQNAAEEEFGTQHLLEVLEAYKDMPLAVIKASVLKSLQEHAGSTLSQDDVTFVIVEVHGGSL